MLTDMKKTIKFFAAVLSLAIAAACSKVDSSDITNDVRPEFNYDTIDITVEALLNGPVDPSETRATLASDGLSVHWTAGDQINMFPFKGTGHYDPSPYEGKNLLLKVNAETISGGSAQFSGTAASGDIYRAIYPAGSLNAGQCYGDYYVFNNYTLKSQTVVENDFPAASWGCTNISMAFDTPKGDVLHFKNMLAYLKFTVNYDNVYSIEVSASSVSAGENRNLDSGKNLGGSLRYRPAKGSFNINTGDYPITVTNNNQPFKKGIIYYIALPAVEATELSMVGKDSNNGIVFSKVKKSNLDIQANTIYNLGSFGESTTVGEDVNVDIFATAEHVKDTYGDLQRTEVKITLQASDASKINDFTFTASLPNGRQANATNPNSTVSMDYTVQNMYLSHGTHSIECNYTVNGNKKSKTITVNVPAPEFTVKTEFSNSYTYYTSGNVSYANSLDAGALTLTRSKAGIAAQTANLLKIAYVVEFNGNKYESTTGNTFNLNKALSSLPAGKYVLKTSATFDGITRTTTQDVYMTGLPMKSFNTSDWNISNGTASNGQLKLTNDASAELKCQTPTDINVAFELNTYVVGHHSTKYSFLYKFIIGNSEYSKSISGDVAQNQYYNCSENTVWKANTPIKMVTDVEKIDNNNPAYVDINKISILYR